MASSRKFAALKNGTTTETRPSRPMIFQPKTNYFSQTSSIRPAGELGSTVTLGNRSFSASTKCSKLYQEIFLENFRNESSLGGTNSASSQRFENDAKPSMICVKLSERWKIH